jgi:hypothetical protein
MNTAASKITLVDSLKHLHELSEKGMSNTSAFNKSHELYLKALMLNFLTKIGRIASLNISNMIESLENK